MLNRPSSRATTAEASIRKEVPDAVISSIECDLQSFDSVRQAAEVMKSKFSGTGIDVLCNNAGVMALGDIATVDGFDVQVLIEAAGTKILKPQRHCN